MAGAETFANRFVFGSNDISSHQKFDLFIGVPQNVRVFNNLGRQYLSNMKSSNAKLQKAHSTVQDISFPNQTTLNEISKQLYQIDETIGYGFAELPDAIYHLENILHIDLSEIKLVLGQIDEKIAELIHLVKFPRDTETADLIKDGIKAIAAGNYDDAEHCLNEAVQKKRTGYQAHLNLAFVYLHKNIADETINHFKKAADYASSSIADESKIFALLCLARAYFAAKDFASAKSIMAQAMDLQHLNKISLPHCKYRFAIYSALDGDVENAISIITEICKRKPIYFAIAATDTDLSFIRTRLLESLDNLVKIEYEKSKNSILAAENSIKEVLNKLTDVSAVQDEIKKFRDILSKCKNKCEANNYTDSVSSNIICESFIKAVNHLPHLSGLRIEYKAYSAKEAEAQKEYDKTKIVLRDEEEAHLEAKKDFYNSKSESEKTVEWLRNHWGLGAGIILIIGFLRGCKTFISNTDDSAFSKFGWGIKWGLIAALAGYLLYYVLALIPKSMRYEIPASLKNAIAKEREAYNVFDEIHAKMSKQMIDIAVLNNSMSSEFNIIDDVISNGIEKYLEQDIEIEDWKA